MVDIAKGMGLSQGQKRFAGVAAKPAGSKGSEVERQRLTERFAHSVGISGLFGLLLGFAMWPFGQAGAVPACPEGVDYIQPSGAAIRIFLRGDEYLHWTEDAAGYTVLFDSALKRWVYATRDAAGQLTTSTAVVGEQDPVQLALPKRLLPDTAIGAARQKAAARLLDSQAEEGRQQAPKTGTMKNLVLLVGFSDKPFTYTKAQYEALFNTVGYTTDGAKGSVKDYYKEVSYNQLNVDSVVVEPVTLANGYAYYGANDAYGDDVRPREMVEEALAALESRGFDFSTLDCDNDGWVDGLTVIHAGGGEEYGGNDSNYIWSHKWAMKSVVTYDGKKMYVYHTESERRGWDSSASSWGITRIGVVCHENGHFLGLPDLYDYGYDSYGVGCFCLMASGSWNGTSGTQPAQMSAWCKKYLNWLTPSAITANGTYSLSRVEDNQTVYKLSGSFPSTQYFLIENRQGYGFDASLPGSTRGLLVWHVDETMANNNDQTHYLVDLEEASGSQHLELYTNSGDDADYFRSGTMTTFNAGTTPDNLSYSGTALGQDITSVSASAATMTLTVGEPSALSSLQFKTSTYSVEENGGSVHIAVSRTGNTADPASVNYASANGTATAGSDYVAVSGTLTWSAGDAADKYFDVAITDDSSAEIAETFNLSLGNASGATLGTPSVTVVTISASDQPRPPANDNFTNAILLSANSGTVVSNTSSATVEVGEPAHAGAGPYKSIWYKFTASSNGTLSIDTHGSSFDTVLALYTGVAVTSLTAVASNDQDGSTNNNSGLTGVSLTGGTTYSVAIAGYDLASYGATVLNWTFTPSGSFPAPTGVRATDGTLTNCVRITWNPVSGAASYRVYRNTSVSAASAAMIGTATGASYDDTYTVQSVNYYYWITAVDDGGFESSLSLPDSGYRGGTALPAPEGVVVSRGVFTDRVVVQWQPLPGASYYRVLRAATLGGTTEAITPWVTTTSGVDWNTTPGVSFWYSVQAALDDTGTGVGPSSAQVEGWRKLLPPSGVVASVGTYSVKISVSWASVVGASRYRVFRATTADQSDRVAVSSWLSATSFNDTDSSLAQGVSYYYTVQAAVDASGNRPSDWSSPAAIGRLGTPLPAPTGVSAWDGQALDKIQISWSAVSGASFYQVLRATTPGGTQTALTNGWFSDTVCFDTTATPGKSYYYVVHAATDAAGSRESADSNEDEGWRLLSPPTGVAASETYTDRVKVTWSAPSGASYYQVWRGLTEGGSKSAVSTWVSGTSFDDTNVLSGVRYYYTVNAAVDAAGTRPSAPGNEDFGWRALQPPASVVASDGEYQNHVRVDWPPVSGASFYRVFRATSSGGTKTVLGVSWQAATNFLDETATPGVTYYYWVQSASDESGTGAGVFSSYNDGWRALSAPVVSASDDTFSDKVYVTWPSVEGASYYRVYRANSGGGEWQPLGSGWISATNYSDTAALPGTSYWYTVQAATSSSGLRPGPLGNADAGRRALAAPTGLAASDGTFAKYVYVNWTASSNATHYQVFRGLIASGQKTALTGWLASTNYLDASAVPGVTYYYSVQAALDENGRQPSVLSVENDGWRALSPPSPVEATDDSLTNGVMVSWGEAYGANYYRVYRMATSNATSRTSLSGWLVGTNYLDTSATPGVIYYYSLQSSPTNTGSRVSAYSVEDTGRRALAAPGGVGASDGTFSDKVRITWTSSSGAARYRVWRSEAETPTSMAPLCGWMTGTTYDDSSATPGVDYLYSVQAATDDSGSLVSPLGVADAGWRGLPAPSWIAASDGDEPLRVNWNSVRGATHYRVYRNTSTSTSTRQALGVWQTDTSYVDSEVTPGVTYYYWVQPALDDTGTRAGAFSAYNDGWLRVSPPNGLTATDGVHNDKVRLTWGPALGASYYKVYRSLSAETAGYEVSGWLNTTNFEDVTAEPGVVYAYFVQSATSSSGSRAGLFSHAETGWRALLAPSEIQATDGTRTDTVRIEWSGVAGAGAYRVWRALAADGVKTPLSGWLTEAWFEDPTAQPGLSYFYSIEAAVDSAGLNAVTSAVSDEGWRGLSVVPWLAATDGVYTNKVHVEWGLSTNATHYRVYRRTVSGGVGMAVSGWIAGSGFDDLSAVPGVNYFYSVVAATDGAGTHSGDFSPEDIGWSLSGAVEPSGFQVWAEERGIGGDLNTAFSGDRDGDGVPNGLEYALGCNWTLGQPVMRIIQVSGVPTLESISQDPATLSDVTVWVETTPSLTEPQWSSSVTCVASDPSRGVEQWRPAQSGSCAFFRLRAVLRP